MYLGGNLQYLRKCNGGMTQEKLAQQMGVSRQTVSKWESGEAYPEVGNLMELCEIFRCSLDDLLRKDMALRHGRSVRVVVLKPFRMAQYIIISPNAETDVLAYMACWARRNGLAADTARIHWAFPYLTTEQRKRFSLKGHGAAYILPENFPAAPADVELVQNQECAYAMLTVQAQTGEALPDAEELYTQVIDYLREQSVKRTLKEGCLPCFQREYEKQGVWYKEVYIQCENTPNAKYKTIE